MSAVVYYLNLLLIQTWAIVAYAALPLLIKSGSRPEVSPYRLRTIGRMMIALLVGLYTLLDCALYRSEAMAWMLGFCAYLVVDIYFSYKKIIGCRSRAWE